MAVLTVSTTDRTIANPFSTKLVAAAGGGDSFPNTGAELAVMKNGSGAPITLTCVIQATVDGEPVTNRTLTLAAGETYIFGPFPTTTYNDANGRMNFTYSGVTSLTVGVFKPATS